MNKNAVMATVPRRGMPVMANGAGEKMADAVCESTGDVISLSMTSCGGVDEVLP